MRNRSIKKQVWLNSKEKRIIKKLEAIIPAIIAPR